MIIPKIIHQIWIGPNKMPNIWMDNIKLFCIKYNFDYMLWDNDTINNINLTNKVYYDIEKTYNGKSDILRYEILYKFGGIYIDADCVIIKDEDFFNLINNFNDSIFNIAFGYEVDYKLITGSVIFSTINNPFIEKCIDEIKFRNLKKMAWKSVGPKLITDIYNDTTNKTNICVYPSKVFYPIRWHGINDINLHTKIKISSKSIMFQYGYSTNNLQVYFN